MQLYEGRLKKLGTAQAGTGQKKYSLIEIGDSIVQNVVVNNKLDNFLDDGLQTTESAKLWTIPMGIMGTGLVAVEVEGGKKYIAAPFSFFAIFFVFGITALFGIIAIFSGMNKGIPYIGALLLALSCWTFYRTIFQYVAIRKDGATIL